MLLYFDLLLLHYVSEIHNKLLHLHSYFPLIVNNKPKHACCGGTPFSVGALSTWLVCLWVNPQLREFERFRRLFLTTTKVGLVKSAFPNATCGVIPSDAAVAACAF